jgi:hypothetical protein
MERWFAAVHPWLEGEMLSSQFGAGTYIRAGVDMANGGNQPAFTPIA